MLGVSQPVPTMQGTQGKGAGEQHSRSRQKGCERATDPAQRSAENPPVQTGCATATHRPGPFLILFLPTASPPQVLTLPGWPIWARVPHANAPTAQLSSRGTRRCTQLFAVRAGIATCWHEGLQPEGRPEALPAPFANPHLRVALSSRGAPLRSSMTAGCGREC